MAVIDAVFHNARIVEVDAVTRDHVFLLEVAFTLAGTYAQADGARLTNVLTRVAAATRQSYSVMTLIDVMRARDGSKADGTGARIGVKTCAISSSDVTFKLTDNSYTTELANGAVPEQSRPLSMLVWAKLVP